VLLRSAKIGNMGKIITQTSYFYALFQRLGLDRLNATMSKKYKTYHIHCGKCSENVLTYHKYGAGKGILRLYHANIVAPENLVNILEKDYLKVNDVPNLVCPNCEEVLGTSTTSKGNKWVYRMRKGYFHRKLVK